MNRDYDTACASALIHPQRLPNSRLGLPACSRKPLVLALWAALAAAPSAAGAATCVSTGSGLWGAAGTWSGCGGGNPGAADDVIIQAGHTVTLDVTKTVRDVTVNGTLRWGNSATARVLTARHFTVNANGTATVNTTSDTNAHRLDLTGNLTANGTFDMVADANSRCRVRFINTASPAEQSIGGTGGLLEFYLLNPRRGAKSRVVALNRSGLTFGTGGYLQISSGTFRVNANGTITPFNNAPATIIWGTNAGFHLNASGAVVNVGIGTADRNITLNGGTFEVSNGTFNLGDQANTRFTLNDNANTQFVIRGGTVNVSGRVMASAVTARNNFTMSGGTLRLATAGNGGGNPAFRLGSNTNTKFTMSGGTIIIRRHDGGAGNEYDNRAPAAGSNVTGGTLQIGDGSTPAGQAFSINSPNAPLWNLTVCGTNNPQALLVSHLTVRNDLLIAAGGRLYANAGATSYNISIGGGNAGGHWTNNGSFFAGTGTVSFCGTANASIGGANVTRFYRLTVNKTASLGHVTLNTTAEVSNQLVFTNGHIRTGANTTLVVLNTSDSGAILGANGSPGYRCVAGNLRRAFSGSFAGTYNFPVCSFNASNASDGDYSPVNLSSSGFITAGNLTVSTTEGDHPNISSSGIDPCRSVNRYWTLTLHNGSFNSTASQLLFTREADDHDAGLNASNVQVRRFSGGTWSNVSLMLAGNVTTLVNNLAPANLTGQYAIGELGGNSCAPSLDHFSLTGGSTAVACEPFTLTLAAHAANHSEAAPTASTTVTLSANVGAGDWSLVSGGGSLNNGAAGDGVATYTFNGSNSNVTLSFYHPTSGNGTAVNFNASNGSISETSGNATAADDLSVTWYRSLFQWRNVSDNSQTLTVQLAGKPSDTGYGAKTLALRAVGTDPNTSACVNLFNGSRAVELAAECNDPVSCTANHSLTINGTAIATAADNGGANASAYTSLNLTFNASSWATFNLSYPNAGNISLHARYDLDNNTGNGYELVGSSNVFTVRPFALRIGDAYETANASHTNPGAANATGVAFLRAGRCASAGDVSCFALNLSAVQWQAADDADNDGRADAGANLTDNPVTPNFGLETAPERFGLRAVTLVSPAGGSSGVLYFNGSDVTAQNHSASGGWANLTQLGYDQVGVFNVTAAVADGDYLGLGAAETGLMNVTSGNIGRFFPARLSITANTPQLADRCTAGGLTYLGQPFYYLTAPQFTLTALSTANTTLSNYGGGTSGADGYWKLNTGLAGRSYTDLANVSNAAFSAALGASAVLSNHLDYDGIGTLTLNATGFSASNCSAHAGSGSDCFLYAKGYNKTAPFYSHFTLTLPASNLTDSDGACYNGSGGTGCEGYNLTVNTTQGVYLHWGRLVMENNHGSELLNLSLPLRIEYWNANGSGSGWLTSSDDSCTALNLASHFLLRNPATGGGANQSGTTAMNVGSGTTNATLSPATAASGTFGLFFSAPGAGNTGFVDVALNATALTPDFDHLRYDWDGDGNHDNWPTARASFGIFSLYRNVIYRREPGW